MRAASATLTPPRFFWIWVWSCTVIDLPSPPSRPPPPLCPRNRRSPCSSNPRHSANSSCTAVRDGRFAYSRNDVRLSLLKLSPCHSTHSPHQFETVVYGAMGSAGVGGHAGRNTAGGV